ncbi:MAG: hypothetical protein QM296_08855 [Bacillota bacterium]|nr:hypothetical protein [Bacillota bacterium]
MYLHLWPKKGVCAREPGHKPRFLAKGGQKMRWCPEIGAGTKKMSRAGLKRAFVPPNSGTNPDFWPLPLDLTGGAAPPLSFLSIKRRQTN